MAGSSEWPCHVCGNVGFDGGSTDDGFFYCLSCGAQAEHIVETGIADEDFVDKGDTRGAIYQVSHRRYTVTPLNPEPISQVEPSRQSQSQFWESFKTPDDAGDPCPPPYVKEEEEAFLDGVGPTEPADFGSGLGSSGPPSFDDYYSELRMRYVMGVQLMIQMQCEALVEKFKANPLICGLSGTIWLRFVASTGIFEDGWADVAIQDSETQEHDDCKSHGRHASEPHNIFGERAIMIWFRSLRKTIPLSCSLAVCFLCCHVARDAVLPTDLLKWSLEGTLPYFAAFLDIEKKFGAPSSACPLRSSFMFFPSRPVPLQKLESLAASIAQSIGLDLPPVNFHAIASRYIRQLSLPLERILLHACRINDWTMSPDLWLSTSESRLPTRVCVMSILIVAVRILYNLHGFGFWEMSLTRRGQSHGNDLRLDMMDDDDDDNSCSDNLESLIRKPAPDLLFFQNPGFDAAVLLHGLEERFDEIGDASEYLEDLPAYLKYCKDVIFAGLNPPFEDHEEEKIIKQLWDFYEKHKDSLPVEGSEAGSDSILSRKRPRDDDQSPEGTQEMKNNGSNLNLEISSADQQSCSHDSEYNPWSNGQDSNLDSKEVAIRRLRSDMEENRFCYIPPRVNVKRFDYLHYNRKKADGSLTYVAHADYYILLRACARIAHVDVRIMHMGVLAFERRLGWTECRISHCLSHRPRALDSCGYCNNGDRTARAGPDDF